MSKPSDFPTAATGFFVGAIVLALVLFGISRMTTSHFEGKEPAAAAETHR